MAEIKTRPATPEYREQWEKIFGKDKTTRPDTGNSYDSARSPVYDHIPGEWVRVDVPAERLKDMTADEILRHRVVHA